LELPLSLYLRRSIDGYESRHGCGPTLHQLAEDLGIPADFGASHLEEHLRRELELGRVACEHGRFRLTTSGRLEAVGGAGTRAGRA
jgi:hypothetical protein